MIKMGKKHRGINTVNNPACRQSRRILTSLLGCDPVNIPAGEPGYGAGSKHPGVMFAFLKHMWSTASGRYAAEEQQEALARCAAGLGSRV